VFLTGLAGDHTMTPTSDGTVTTLLLWQLRDIDHKLLLAKEGVVIVFEQGRASRYM
jgi:hypothetical protein